VQEQKIEFLYCNQHPVDGKDLFYFVIVMADIKGFIVCKNKIEDFWTQEGDHSINCIDFTSSSHGVRAAGDKFAVGTEDGKVLTFDITKKQLIHTFQICQPPIVDLKMAKGNMMLMSTAEPAVYGISFDPTHLGQIRIGGKFSECESIKVSEDMMSFALGFQNFTIDYYKFIPTEQGEHKFMHLKEIKNNFSLFDIDPLMSSLVFLNPKGREIEFYISEWEWNTEPVKNELAKTTLIVPNEDLAALRRISNAKKMQKDKDSSCCSIF
jgi:hypothetical protein